VVLIVVELAVGELIVGEELIETSGRWTVIDDGKVELTSSVSHIERIASGKRRAPHLTRGKEST